MMVVQLEYQFQLKSYFGFRLLQNQNNLADYFSVFRLVLTKRLLSLWLFLQNLEFYLFFKQIHFLYFCRFIFSYRFLSFKS